MNFDTLFNRIRRRFPPEIVSAVRADSLTFLEVEALNDLYYTVKAIERERIPGCLIETGCAAGGSAIVLANAKQVNRPLAVYDVFGMIPPPSEKDEEDVHRRYELIKAGGAEGIGGRAYYGYEEDLMQAVIDSFDRHDLPVGRNNVRMIKGLFEDTITLDEPVALAHIDGDWYESVYVCLERIAPNLVLGGRFVIDDYDAWSGCRKAVDDFFKGRSEEFVFVKKSRLHIVRSH
ncbi:MAG: TylF/MycF/NovP-related O-methyltransferase [Verrucomicrobiales bacterium]